jgi:guanine deaminase
MYDHTFLLRAIALSARALTEPGTQPFGAVVVRDGVVVGEGFNHSAAHHDPTSHGEVEAIRDACRRLETVDLSGCDLYASCEPCALCVAAMAIAGIRDLYYAASLAEAGEAMKGIAPARRHPIDSVAVRELAGKAARRAAPLPAPEHTAEAVRVIAEWADETGRR